MQSPYLPEGGWGDMQTTGHSTTQVPRALRALEPPMPAGSCYLSPSGSSSSSNSQQTPLPTSCPLPHGPLTPWPTYPYAGHQSSLNKYLLALTMWQSLQAKELGIPVPVDF